MPTDAEKVDFVMSHVANSRRFQRQFITKWREILGNFIVDPDVDLSRSVTRPFGQARYPRFGSSFGGLQGNIVLKSGETHKAIMSLAATLVSSLFGNRRGEYIHASPRGYEDATKSSTVTKLLRYVFSLRGNYRAMVEAIMDMLLMGTAVIKTGWKTQERDMPVRSIQAVENVELETIGLRRVLAFDDVQLEVIDNQKFYPDPSATRIEDMSGVAEQFDITKNKARARATRGVYRSEAVERAARGAIQKSNEDEWRKGLDQPQWTEKMQEFVPMVGFRYWGEVPWQNDDTSRRLITVINGELVQDEAFPLGDPELPFHALIINPVQGRFYGISPAEVIRYDQDLMDAARVLLAEAIIRQVHPPLAFDQDSDLDVSALQQWRADVVLPVKGGARGIGTVQYDANVFNGFALLQNNKTEMQETSGALAPLQGQPLSPGSQRGISATAAQFQQQRALGRPEMAAAILERESLPSIGQGILRRYQQFLDDSEALRERVGELPEPARLRDVMGDFDIQFTGSRQAISRQEKLLAYDRLIAMSQVIPEVRLLVPWLELLPDLIGDTLELPEAAAKLGGGQDVRLNALLEQLGVGPGAGANTRTTQPQIPTQAAGAPGG